MASFIASSRDAGQIDPNQHNSGKDIPPQLDGIETLRNIQSAINTFFANKELADRGYPLTPEQSPRLLEQKVIGETKTMALTSTETLHVLKEKSASVVDELQRIWPNGLPISANKIRSFQPEAVHVTIPAEEQQPPRQVKTDTAQSKPAPSTVPEKKTPDPSTQNARLVQLASEISTNVQKLSLDNGDSAAAARIRAATAALELAAAIRPPQDTLMGLFANMSIVSAIRLFSHWRGFDLIPTDDPEGISYSNLSQLLKADESLLRRILSLLRSSGILSCPPQSQSHISHTPTSLLLRSSEPMSAMFSLMYTNVVEVSTVLPDYFDTYGRKEPVGPGHIPTSYLAGKPEAGYFEVLEGDQEKLKDFGRAMGMVSRRVPVTGMWDMDKLTKQMEREKDDKEKRVVWCDVGGGEGHVLQRFKEEYPELSELGRCVVVDLKGVVDEARAKAEQEQKEKEKEKEKGGDHVRKGVEFLEGDFMKVGGDGIPVKGAMVYYLRHILRDYSDKVAVGVLRNIAAVMEKDTSRVLISEQLSPGAEKGTMPLYAAFKDWTMLSIGGKERTVEEFAAIAREAGLKVEGVYRDQVTPQGVLELVLMD